MRERSAFEMPTPRSRTRIPRRPTGRARATPEIVRDSGEYFMALSSRFESTQASASRSTLARTAVTRSLDYDVDALSHSLAAELVHDVADEDVSVDGSELERQGVGFDPAELQKAFDQPVQAAAFVLQGLVVLLPTSSLAARPCASNSLICRIAVNGVRNSCDTADTKSDCSRATRSSRMTERPMR